MRGIISQYGWANFKINVKGTADLQRKKLPDDLRTDIEKAVGDMTTQCRSAERTFKAMTALWCVIARPATTPAIYDCLRHHITLPYGHLAYTLEQIRGHLHIPEYTRTSVCMDVSNLRSQVRGVQRASFACDDCPDTCRRSKGSQTRHRKPRRRLSIWDGRQWFVYWDSPPCL